MSVFVQKSTVQAGHPDTTASQTTIHGDERSFGQTKLPTSFHKIDMTRYIEITFSRQLLMQTAHGASPQRFFGRLLRRSNKSKNRKKQQYEKTFRFHDVRAFPYARHRQALCNRTFRRRHPHGYWNRHPGESSSLWYPYTKFP